MIMVSFQINVQSIREQFRTYYLHYNLNVMGDGSGYFSVHRAVDTVY